MSIYRIVIVAAVLCAMTLPAVQAEEPAKPAAKPTTRPAAKVVAMVGKTPITGDTVDQAMKRMGAPSKQQALDQLIVQELIEAYARTIPCTDKDIEAWKTKMSADLKARKLGTLEEFMAKRNIPKEEIPLMVRFEKINQKAMKATSTEAIAAFIKANPTYFDGTEVQASHILLSCSPGTATIKRAEARKQLEQIAADIKADKIKFADAARKHSKCPSGKQSGGDLGSFAFHKMVTPFSQTAFAMKAGDVSDIVETQFGFHIIKLTKSTAGTGKPGPNARQIARQTLLGNFRAKVTAKARENNPITIMQ